MEEECPGPDERSLEERMKEWRKKLEHFSAEIAANGLLTDGA